MENHSQPPSSHPTPSFIHSDSCSISCVVYRNITRLFASLSPLFAICGCRMKFCFRLCIHRGRCGAPEESGTDELWSWKPLEFESSLHTVLLLKTFLCFLIRIDSKLIRSMKLKLSRRTRTRSFSRVSLCYEKLVASQDCRSRKQKIGQQCWSVIPMNLKEI